MSEGEEWFLDTMAIPIVIILILISPVIIMHIIRISAGG